MLSNTPLILHIIVKINALGSFCMLKMTDSQCFFVLLQLTFVSLSRHFGKRRALLILAFTIKFSQNLNAQKGRGCNNAHVTDIYYPERENYILALREWLLLILLCGQCEKPDCRDKQNTVLTLFAFINLAFQRGMRSNANFYEDIKIYRNGYFSHYYER